MQPNNGEISSRVCVDRFPRESWADDETVQRIAARVFGRDIFIFHFYADFQTLVRQENRSHNSLREAPLATAVAGIFFFEKPVHGPFKSPGEFLSEEQTKFIGIWNLGRSAFFLLFFFSSCSRGRWHFFMSNGANAEFVFREECWIERNLVPISKSPSCFKTHCLRSAAAVESFELRFRSDVKTIGQTHFDLLGEQIIGWPVAESLTLKKLAEEECPWRQHVRIYCVGKTATRKRRWRTIGTGYLLRYFRAVITTGSSVVEVCARTEQLRTGLRKQAPAIRSAERENVCRRK